MSDNDAKNGGVARRDFLKGAAVGAAGLAVAGSTAPSRVAAAAVHRSQVTLTFWKGPHTTLNEEANGIAGPILRRFEKENPGVTVDFVLTPWASWTEKYTTAFASGNPPDVSYMTEAVGKFALAGQLLDLDPFIATAKVAGQSLKSYVLPRAWGVGTFHGKIMGVPWIIGGSNLWWNKDMFKKAGLDPEKPPSTWEELVAYGKKLTKPPHQWGYFAPPNAPLEDAYWGLQAGGSWFNNSVTRATVNQPAYVKGVQFLSDLFNRYQIAVPASLASVQNAEYTFFSEGKAAMMSEQNTIYNTLRADKKVTFHIGAAPRPKGPAPDPLGRAAYGGVGLLSIATASKHRAEAWRLVEFLMRPENLKAWIGQLGFMSVAPSVNFYEGDPVMTAAQKTLKYTYFFPYLPNIFQVWDLLGSSIQAVILQQQTAQQAMNALATKIDAALRQAH